MKSESNRQNAPRRAPTVEERDATLARLAALFPDGTRVGDGTVADYQAWANGPARGRPHRIFPADFAAKRAAAVVKLRKAGPKPTRARIAAELGINVRTLYDYDHRAAGGSPGVPISIEGPGFRIELGR